LGLASTGLTFLAGAIRSRSGSLHAAALGGLATRMPRLTALFLLFAMASIGLPGTSGFPAELLILLGAFRTHPGSGAIALVSLVLGAASMLRLVARAFFGRPREDSAWMPDIQPRELLVAGSLGAAVLLIGLWPDPILSVSRAACVRAHPHIIEQEATGR
jgi:NADH-quinone oxidoreductase subunit M